jgi:hypothetical protein
VPENVPSRTVSIVWSRRPRIVSSADSVRLRSPVAGAQLSLKSFWVSWNFFVASVRSRYPRSSSVRLIRKTLLVGISKTEASSLKVKPAGAALRVSRMLRARSRFGTLYLEGACCAGSRGDCLRPFVVI